jgi:hypothetical protein
MAYGRTVLGGSGSLCGHLQFANLSLGQSSIVVVAVWTLLRLGLLLWLLLELWRLWLRLVQTRGLTVWPVEVYAGGGWWYLALGLEQARLQIDDVVAQLVVLGLEGLVQLAQLLELFHLVFQLLYILLFALAKRALAGRVSVLLR